MYQVGLLQVGQPEGAVVRGVLASARQHGLNVEQCSAQDAQARWPGFRVPEGLVGVFEPAAGYLRVERCVLAHLAAAKQQGAEFRFGSAVCARRAIGDSVEVETESGETYRAAKLIVTAGPWAPQLLADLGVPFAVRRKHVYWFPTSDSFYHEDRHCPTFLFELPRGVFYGFPQRDVSGVKVAEHSGGVSIANPLADPRDLDPTDLGRVEAFLTEHLPGVGRPMTGRSVCYYTMSPDEHFVVDRHPQQGSLLFAAGLSGHGFKFTSVLGEALADLALAGRTDLPIEFLQLGRFTNIGPSW